MADIIAHNNVESFENWNPPDINQLGTSDISGGNGASGGQLQAMLEQARQEGYQRAMQELPGQQQQQFESTYQSKLDQLLQLIRALNQPVAEIESSLEQSALELVTAIVKKIFFHEIAINAEQLTAIIKQALRLIPTNQAIQIKLSSSDVELLKSAITESEDETLLAMITEDASLKPGSCLLSSGSVTLDAGIDRRIQHIFEQILQQESQ